MDAYLPGVVATPVTLTWGPDTPTQVPEVVFSRPSKQHSTLLQRLPNGELRLTMNGLGGCFEGEKLETLMSELAELVEAYIDACSEED